MRFIKILNPPEAIQISIHVYWNAVYIWVLGNLV